LRFLHIVNFRPVPRDEETLRKRALGPPAIHLEAGAQGSIPGEAKLGGISPVTELIGTFPAHPDRGAGAGDRPGRRELLDEMTLPCWSPAIVAGFGRDRGEADTGTAHPTA